MSIQSCPRCHHWRGPSCRCTLHHVSDENDPDGGEVWAIDPDEAIERWLNDDDCTDVRLAQDDDALVVWVNGKPYKASCSISIDVHTEEISAEKAAELTGVDYAPAT